MTALDDWTAAVRAVLALDEPAPEEQRLVLDLARDVAHGVLRPAAPLTAYLVGLAVGRGADLAAASQQVSDLAAGWTTDRPAGPTTEPAARTTDRPADTADRPTG